VISPQMQAVVVAAALTITHDDLLTVDPAMAPPVPAGLLLLPTPRPRRSVRAGVPAGLAATAGEGLARWAGQAGGSLRAGRCALSSMPARDGRLPCALLASPGPQPRQDCRYPAGG
jgi:hypothetical protein